jgi:metal-responsive CopG/Arc/MetJ family transcriptional regulator
MAEMKRFEMLAPPDWLDRVDAWRVRQPGIPSRGEAIRRLVEQTLGKK